MGLIKFGARSARRNLLFDHFVGAGEKRQWDFEAERLGGLEVDCQLELCRQYNRQIARLLTLEDAAGINASLPVCTVDAWRIAHQTAGSDGFGPAIDRGDAASGCQRDNQVSMGTQKRP